MNHLAFGMPGPAEWIWIAVILVLLFGARKLPELARAMGSSVTQFKKGLKDETKLLDEPDEPDEPEEQAEPKERAAPKEPAEPRNG